MKKMFFVFVVCAVASLLVHAGCEKAQVGTPAGEEQTQTGQSHDLGGAEVTESATVSGPATGTVSTVVFNTTAGAVPISVEIAQTDEERAKGLQNRESLPENSGMWFVFPQIVHEQFWMKDTKFPLDLIYVDDGMKVVHIVENAPAGDTDPARASSPIPFKYVLEVNGGTAARNGIRVGDIVQQRIGPR